MSLTNFETDVWVSDATLPSAQYKQYPDPLTAQTTVPTLTEAEPKAVSNQDHLLSIASFNNVTDNRPKPAQMKWGEFLARVRQPLIRANKKGAAYSFAVFREPQRLNEFVEAHTAIVLDLDHGLSFAEAEVLARATCYECALHTTHSHGRVTKENPQGEDRARVIFPLKTPVPARFVADVRQIVKGWFNGLSDANADDLARLFFKPSKVSVDAPYEFSIVSGQLLDWAALGILAFARVGESDLSVKTLKEIETSENQERVIGIAVLDGKGNVVNESCAELCSLMSVEEVEAEQRAAAVPAYVNGKVADSDDLTVSGEVSGNALRKYILAALQSECAAVGSEPPGGRNARLNKAACSIGGFLHANVVSRSEMEAALEQAAQACGLWQDDGAAQCHKTIKSGLDAGAKKPRALPERKQSAPSQGHLNGATASVSADNVPPEPAHLAEMFDSAQSESKAKALVTATLSKIISAQTLLSTDYPEPVFAVHGLLPQGVSFLAGPPKLGKSILSLGLAVAVAEGGKALSTLNVERGSVLYLALEDSPRRIQERLQKITRGSISDRLHIANEWPRLDEGGLDAIDEWIKSKPDARLLIVDTLKMLRPQQRGRNSSVYNEDYDAIQPLTKIAAQRVALLVVHHTRKALADDPLATVSGSYGLTGAADGVLVLARSRNRSDGTLSVIGRDLEEKELALKFDGNLCMWSVIGEAAEVRRSTERQAVLEFLRELNELATPVAVSRGMGKERDAIRQLLRKMAVAGEIKSFGDGRYQLPDYVPVTDAVTAVTGSKKDSHRKRSGKALETDDLPEPVTAVTAVTGITQLPLVESPISFPPKS